MTDQPHVPTHQLDTEWGTVLVTCTHPHKVAFTAGFANARLVVNRVDYLCEITFSRAGLTPDQRSNREMLGGGWHIRRTAAWWGLRRPGHLNATDSARRTFNDRIIPGFHQWLATSDARALRVDGDRYWRHNLAEQIAATENDLVAAFQRLQDIAARVARGETIDTADETFATKARVQVP